MIVEDNVVAHAQRRVVHRLGKGGGLFVNIPERTLGIGEKHVHLVREDALDEPVHDAHLKFGIAVVLVNASPEIGTGHEIIVLVYPESRDSFQFATYAVAVGETGYIDLFRPLPFFLPLFLSQESGRRQTQDRKQQQSFHHSYCGRAIL